MKRLALLLLLVISFSVLLSACAPQTEQPTESASSSVTSSELSGESASSAATSSEPSEESVSSVGSSVPPEESSSSAEVPSKPVDGTDPSTEEPLTVTLEQVCRAQRQLGGTVVSCYLGGAGRVQELSELRKALAETECAKVCPELLAFADEQLVLIGGFEFWLILPLYPEKTTVSVCPVDQSEAFEVGDPIYTGDGKPIIVLGNMSDIMENFQVTVTVDGEENTFMPCLSPAGDIQYNPILEYDEDMTTFDRLRERGRALGKRCVAAGLGVTPGFEPDHFGDRMFALDVLLQQNGSLKKYPELLYIPEDRRIIHEGYEIYLILPVDPLARVTINPTEFTDEDDAVILDAIYEGYGEPVLLICNQSDLYTNCNITVSDKNGKTTFSFSESLKDGEMLLPEEILWLGK